MRFSSIKVDPEIPLHGVTSPVSILKSAEGPAQTDGWEMQGGPPGVVCRKGERVVFIPWARVVIGEVIPEATKAKAEGK